MNSRGEAFQKALDSLADEDDDRGDLLRGAGDVQGLKQLVESLHVWGGRQAGALLDERLQLGVNLVQDGDTVLTRRHRWSSSVARDVFSCSSHSSSHCWLVDCHLLCFSLCQGLEAWDVPGELVEDGSLCRRGLANLESDRVGHPLRLVGQGHRVTVAPALFAGHLSQLNLDVQTFVDLWDCLLHRFLLDEGTGQLHIVVRDHGNCDIDSVHLSREKVPAQGHHDVLQIVLDGEQQVVSAGDHGHPCGEVPHHVVRGNAHSGFVEVKREVLLDDLLAGGDGDLDGTLDHRGDPLLHTLLDGQLDQLVELGVLFQERQPLLHGDVRHEA